MRFCTVLLVLSLAACGDNLPNCDTAMSWGGPEVICFDEDGLGSEGPDGVCIADEQNVPACRRRCASAGPLCQEDEWWYSMTVSDDGTSHNVCYCAPPPMRHVAIVRDHR